MFLFGAMGLGGSIAATTATGEFGIVNQYGGISTYFVPDMPIMDYWIQQVEDYMH